MRPFDQGTLEDALIPAVDGSTVSLQRGVVTSPGKVLCPGDQEGNAVDGPIGAVGQLGYVLSVNGHRMWLPFDAAVPWTSPGRHITIDPDGYGQPTLEMIRERPGYTARAVTYLAASGATTELAGVVPAGRWHPRPGRLLPPDPGVVAMGRARGDDRRRRRARALLHRRHDTAHTQEGSRLTQALGLVGLVVGLLLRWALARWLYAHGPYAHHTGSRHRAD